MAIVIRAAALTDLESLFDIRTSVTQNHLSREQMADLGITSDALAEAIGSATCAWLAVVDGLPVAFSMVDLEGGEVFAMFVKPGYEGRGLGRQLMLEAEKALFQHHESIWLVTDGREEIRANGFYQRLGWSYAGDVEAGDVRYEKKRPNLFGPDAFSGTGRSVVPGQHFE